MSPAEPASESPPLQSKHSQGGANGAAANGLRRAGPQGILEETRRVGLTTAPPPGDSSRRAGAPSGLAPMDPPMDPRPGEPARGGWAVPIERCSLGQVPPMEIHMPINAYAGAGTFENGHFMPPDDGAVGSTFATAWSAEPAPAPSYHAAPQPVYYQLSEGQSGGIGLVSTEMGMRVNHFAVEQHVDFSTEPDVAASQIHPQHLAGFQPPRGAWQGDTTRILARECIPSGGGAQPDQMIGAAPFSSEPVQPLSNQNSEFLAPVVQQKKAPKAPGEEWLHARFEPIKDTAVPERPPKKAGTPLAMPPAVLNCAQTNDGIGDILKDEMEMRKLTATHQREHPGAGRGGNVAWGALEVMPPQIHDSTSPNPDDCAKEFMFPFDEVMLGENLDTPGEKRPLEEGETDRPGSRLSDWTEPRSQPPSPVASSVTSNEDEGVRSKCFSAPGYMEQFNSYEPFSSPPASPSGMRKKLAEAAFQDPFAKIAPEYNVDEAELQHRLQQFEIPSWADKSKTVEELIDADIAKAEARESKPEAQNTFSLGIDELEAMSRSKKKQVQVKPATKAEKPSPSSDQQPAASDDYTRILQQPLKRADAFVTAFSKAFSPEHVKAIRRIIDMKKPFDEVPLKSEHDAKALILHSLAVSTVKKMPTDFETFSNEMFESQAVKRHFHDPPYHSKLKSFMACLSGTIRKVKAVAGLVGKGKTPVKTQDKTRGKTPGAAKKLGAGVVKREKPQGQIFVSGRDRMDRDGRMKLDAQVGLGRTVDGRSMGMNVRQQSKSSPKKGQPSSPKKSQPSSPKKSQPMQPPITVEDATRLASSPNEKRLAELLGSKEFKAGRNVRALAVAGEVLGVGEPGIPILTKTRCRPLSQSAGFAEAYVAQTDLPSDHLQHIKNLAARAAEERENSDLSAAQEWMNVPVENAEEARALIYHYRLIRIAGAMETMKASEIPQTISGCLMQNIMLKSLVICNENQNAPLPRIASIIQEEPLKTASAVVAKMAGVPLPADYCASDGLLEMHEAAVGLRNKAAKDRCKTRQVSTPPSSPSLRVDSPPFLPPGSPCSL